MSDNRVKWANKLSEMAGMWVSGLVKKDGALYIFKTEREMRIFRLGMYRLRDTILRKIEEGKTAVEDYPPQLLQAFRHCRLYVEDERTLTVAAYEIGACNGGMEAQIPQEAKDIVKAFTSQKEQEAEEKVIKALEKKGVKAVEPSEEIKERLRKAGLA